MSDQTSLNVALPGKLIRLRVVLPHDGTDASGRSSRNLVEHADTIPLFVARLLEEEEIWFWFERKKFISFQLIEFIFGV